MKAITHIEVTTSNTPSRPSASIWITAKQHEKLKELHSLTGRSLWIELDAMLDLILPQVLAAAHEMHEQEQVRKRIKKKGEREIRQHAAFRKREDRRESQREYEEDAWAMFEEITDRLDQLQPDWEREFDAIIDVHNERKKAMWKTVRNTAQK
jgi:hypothetical protein